MNKEKRKDILRILGSGWSASVIGMKIGNILNQPEEDILRIINNLSWNRKHILTAFDNFPQSKTKYREVLR